MPAPRCPLAVYLHDLVGGAVRGAADRAFATAAEAGDSLDAPAGSDPGAPAEPQSRSTKALWTTTHRDSGVLFAALDAYVALCDELSGLPAFRNSARVVGHRAAPDVRSRRRLSSKLPRIRAPVPVAAGKTRPRGQRRRQGRGGSDRRHEGRLSRRSARAFRPAALRSSARSHAKSWSNMSTGRSVACETSGPLRPILRAAASNFISTTSSARGCSAF